jgi:hypothetical protein
MRRVIARKRSPHRERGTADPSIPQKRRVLHDMAANLASLLEAYSACAPEVDSDEHS